MDTTPILKEVEKQIAELAKTSFQNYASQAQKDGTSFLIAIEKDMNRWVGLLEANEISPADFKDLILGQQELFRLVALKQAGLAAIQADRFKHAVLNLLINTTLSVLKPGT